MRKLLWLLLAVAAVALGAPYIVGVLAEREAYKQVERVQDNPTFTLKISKYDRGWLASDVTYEYGLKDEYVEALAQSTKDANADSRWQELAAPLELVSVVKHGPVIINDGLFFGLFTAKTTTGLDNPRLNKFLQATGMPHLFVAKNATGFSGVTDFTVEMPSIDAVGDDLPTETELRSIEFSGLRITGNYDPVSKKVVTTGSSENLSVVADNLSLTLQGFDISADTSTKIESMPMGTVDLAIAQMTLFDATAAQAERVELTDFSMAADTKVASTADTADAIVTYKLAEAQLGEDKVTDIELTARVSDLSITAAQNYSKWSEKFLTLDPENPEGANDLLADLNPIARQFMQTSPTLTIEPIKFTAGSESFTSNFSVSVDGSRLPDGSEFDATSIPMWMGALSGVAGASISEALATTMAISNARSQLLETLGEQDGITEQQINDMAANQAPVIIETLIQQGLIARDSGQLAAEVRYRNGELLLNGNPMPIDALLGGM